ncbi:MAG: DUF1800 domain-containing protein [Acidobacteriota bacterium]|nr:DUF1800 domain-containing protein [Acidobacteriota bacterium]
MKFARSKSFLNQMARKPLALLTLTAVFTLPFTATAQKMSQPQQAKKQAVEIKKLTEDQKILHVLNRLGFGARPGDLKKIRQIGLEKYIEQQLNPEKIDDSVAQAKVQNLEVLKMSNAELFSKYPNQAAVLQVVAQQTGTSVQQLRQAEIRGNGRANGRTKAERKAGIGGDETAMMKEENAAPQAGNLSEEERRRLQQQANQIYRQLDLRRPNEINAQLNASRILRAVYSERQLQEQMVDFWTNHFNVFTGKGATRWFLPEYDRDVIRPNAMGNFRDLLAATAKSPAMLFFLDNHQSVAENNNQNQQLNRRLQRIQQNGGKIPAQMMARLREQFPNLSDAEIEQRIRQQQQRAQNRQRRGINENYARELMELHTLGVDGGYTQKDIQEVARAFTGWTIVDPRGYRNSVAKLLGEKEEQRVRGMMRLGGMPADAESGTFYFNERAHDKGEKTILGQKIPAGGGIEDGLKVIDILVKHPSTAKFIARKLAVKFVNDNPNEALVKRVADAFQKSNGDIKTTLRALFSSPEFFAPENYRAKIKTPFEVLVSAIRAVNADTNASPALQAMLAKMGEPLYGYQAPTGYPDTAEDWVNTGALLERLNYGLALAANRIPGTRVDLTKVVGRDPDNKEKVLETFVAAVLHNEVSPVTKQTMLKQLNQQMPEPKLDAPAMTENVSMPQGGGRRNQGNQVRLLPPSGNAEVVKILGLVLGSPEFQRQ